MEGRGVRSATSRAGRARPRLYERMGQSCRRLCDDARRVLLQGPDRAGAGGNQARRRGVRARLRYPRPQHFQPAVDSGAISRRCRRYTLQWHNCHANPAACCDAQAGLVWRRKSTFYVETPMSPAEARLKDVASDMTEAEWSQRVNLAACYRLVAHYGWDDLV